VSAGRDQPQDGESLAVRPEGSEFRRGACHLCAGEDHRSETAESAVSLRAGADPDSGSAGGEDDCAENRGAVGRAPSTISREIRRNSDPDGRYRPHQAEQAARRRAGKPRTRRLAVDTVLAEVVQRLLAKRWSPEQVAHELRVLFAGQPSRWLCKETIYQAIYDTAVSLTRPARRRRRRRRLQGLQRRGRLTAMRMIDERPVEVEDRVEPGHWEGDLIMGAGNRSAIGTLVERTTRYLVLLPFSDGIATTDGVRQAITDALESVPAGLRRTLTWDQGKELAQHQQITVATGTDVFFCDPHSPWQRGSNENINGLLRDYFPKGTDLSVHSVEDVVRIAAEVNDRPRKTLGLAAPRGALRRRERGPLRGPPEPRTRAGIDSGSALGPHLRRTPRRSATPPAPRNRS